MHLLAATPGEVDDGSEAVDLGQTPGDVIVLSAAESELALLAKARAGLGEGFPTVRLASLLSLGHNLSVDIHVDRVISAARLVVVRLLGGEGYWPYGLEQITAVCRRNGIALAVVPGDEQPDPGLAGFSTLAPDICHRLWQYCARGGPENAENFLRFAAHLIDEGEAPPAARPVLRAGLYWPGAAQAELSTLRAHWTGDGPIAAVVFYRALYQAGNLAPVDALVDALASRGLNPLPLFVASLKDEVSAATAVKLFGMVPPSVILNATGFAVSVPGAERTPSPLDDPGCPVLQVVFSGGSREGWEARAAGLSARDIAMNVALPEVDGRVLSRAVSFKTQARFDAHTESPVVAYAPVADRIDFVADLAAGWVRLALTAPAERRMAVIFANYPNRDGRLGNGVGLDTPAGAFNLLRAMAKAGYDVGELPPDGGALIARLGEGPTNVLSNRSSRPGGVRFPLDDYARFFAGLPAELRDEVIERWGRPEDDPFVEGDSFRLSAFHLGNTVVGLQPARGYNIDPVRSYHDPDLVPPHGYFAFYAWLRSEADVHAVVHFGKHGNLEWLPGKALALSATCYPEAALGPVPNVYPFIVNDPGEGTQAKRRAAAVIVDHLTPPLTRAESYGPLRDLEQLVDEYYEASGLDPRRLKVLGRQILEACQQTGLDQDCGMAPGEAEDKALAKLDNYLCELKEMQIRDGLHVFGVSPTGGELTDLLVALVRLPRGDGRAGDASLLRALATDLGLDEFDPLDCTLGSPWHGARPGMLLNGAAWRTCGDTVERLEHLACDLVSGQRAPLPAWTRTCEVLEHVAEVVRPAVAASGEAEIRGILTALDGRFLEPGPSGAPTRGRLDVLPTGRNFYSIDTRTVPTPAAWLLGWKSADQLVERHRQDHGTWPRRLALSAWGTSNMRTGGDDIAQTLALMGTRPTWDSASRRVTGFEILPLDLLDRPRVDVTLRISGFFRDAFPSQIDLVDSAARAVADLDEPEDMNPLSARVAGDAKRLMAAGVDEAMARRRAGFRVFGSKPGAYGAGLQALIDEKGWDTAEDLARAYLAWGGYAYGSGAAGTSEHDLFATRLTGVEAVVHNQDNREHDLLDSDDYYQFEGGLAAAVTHLKGERPVVYHNDHSWPESPRVRTLEEEIGRVVRARVVNPKWIRGVMRHGYKGAFEMAATVDYMFAFAATTGAVADHHFDAVFDAFIGDGAVREFIATNNPAALAEIADRLLEAHGRDLWRPRLNTAYATLSALTGRIEE